MTGFVTSHLFFSKRQEISDLKGETGLDCIYIGTICRFDFFIFKTTRKTLNFLSLQKIFF